MKRSGSPEAEAKPVAGEQPAGLFDERVLIDMLCEDQRGLGRREAEKLVGQYAHFRVKKAITDTDFKQAEGMIKKTYRAALYSFLKQNWKLDKRVAGRMQREAEEMNYQSRKAEEAELREQQRRETEEHRRVLSGMSEDEIERYSKQVIGDPSNQSRFFQEIYNRLPFEENSSLQREVVKMYLADKERVNK